MSNQKHKIVSIFWRWFALHVMIVICMVAFANAQPMDLTEMSIEELMDVKVISVSKKLQSLSESPAAVFVITNDDLRRSGVTTIPDALRMVPGIQVARIDSNKWAISSRGSNTRFFDKLLVMIDGRSVYTASFSGVYWEVQDMMLEDVERIEVIRGPGATLWGANAVNGVINIITKSAADTQKGVVSFGGGTYEKLFLGARYGAAIGQNSHGRIYVKGFARDSFSHLDDSDAGDDWGMQQGGFRFDSKLTASDSLTLQGDIYRGDIEQTLSLPLLSEPYVTTVDDSIKVDGGNILARWQRILSSASELTVQAYYDRTKRQEAYANNYRDSFDVDIQYHLAAIDRNDVNWGVRYRRTLDDFTNSDIIQFDPQCRTDDLFSTFIQDEIALVQQKLWLTLGTKIEHNDYTGYEIQPSARLFWSVNRDHKLWASVSRAVRTPSRVETDGRVTNIVYPPAGSSPLPVVPTIIGSDDFQSETLMAYEVGYRFVPGYPISVDFALFYNVYDRLRSTAFGVPELDPNHIYLPIYFDNVYSDETYGVELAMAWHVKKWLDLDLAYSYLECNMEEGVTAGRAPKHQVSVRSAIKLRENLDMDLWLRYMDDSTMVSPTIPDHFYSINDYFTNFFYPIDDYFTLDARLAWQVHPSIEFSLVGQNLLGKSHLEAVQEAYTTPTQVHRSVYGKITWQF